MEDWSNLCRSCLASGNQVSLFGDDSEIRQKFTETTSIEPKQDDGLPPNLCCDCILLMNSAHQFKKQCQKLDAELKQQLENIRQLTQKQKQSLKKVNIKKEQYDEEDDDFYYVLVIDEKQNEQEIPGDNNQYEENIQNKTQSLEVPLQQVKIEPQDLEIPVAEPIEEPIEIPIDVPLEIPQSLLSNNGSFPASSISVLEAAKLPGAELPIDFMDMGEPEDSNFDTSNVDSSSVDVNDDTSISIEPHIVLTTDQDNITTERLVELLGGERNSLSDGTLLLKDSNGEYIRCIPSSENEDEVILCDGDEQFQFLNCDDGSELVIQYTDDTQVATVLQQEDGSYVCSCGDILQTLDNYDDHLMTHHNQQTTNLFADHRLLKDSVVDRLQCHICKKTFSNVNILKKHYLSHEKDKNVLKAKHIPNILSKHDKNDDEEEEEMHTVGYACIECGELFTSHSALSAHTLRHTTRSSDESHLCPQCGSVFATKRAASLHMALHVPIKNKSDRFTCTMCGKKCPSNAMLLMHERVHTNERPFPCLQCSLRFKTKTHLRTHMLTHTQEKKYGCSVCMKFFALKGNLVVHLRTHTGERPYACGICNEAFIDSKYLKNHKKKKHDIQLIPWNEFSVFQK